MSEKRTDLMLKEIKYFFLSMAERTGTLWENTYETASCNHGLVGVVGRWIVYVLTGFRGIKDGYLQIDDVKKTIDCRIIIPLNKEKILMDVKNGILYVNGKMFKN